MNEEELERNLFKTTKTVDLFVDMALDLDEAEGLSGFHYDRDLLKAAMADTYVETVGDKADSLHVQVPYLRDGRIRNSGEDPRAGHLVGFIKERL